MLAISRADAKGMAFDDLGFREDGYPFNWKSVHDEVTYEARWTVHHWRVVENIEDGTFWSFSYELAATEYQENEFDDPTELTLVYPHQVTTTVYKPKPQVLA